MPRDRGAQRRGKADAAAVQRELRRLDQAAKVREAPEQDDSAAPAENHEADKALRDSLNGDP